MSAQLSPSIDPIRYISPNIYETFFDEDEKNKLFKDYFLPRECTLLEFPPSCDVNLFFGFFFDGTNNNLKRDRATHSHSNVARLYEAFPGDADDHGSEAWQDYRKKYQDKFFRTYIPGVGTAFKEVGDRGDGFSWMDDRPRGLAFCHKGENRIIWALVQSLNNIHRYFTGSLLIDDAAFKKSFNTLSLPRFAESALDPDMRDENASLLRPHMRKLKAAFSAALRELQEALRAYLPVGPGKYLDRGKVMHIYVSTFGFSRGATMARAFANWLVWLCRLDAEIAARPGLSLCSIPVKLDFLGLFDTVAAVGVSSSIPFAHGHQMWADADRSLCVPAAITRCLHLVSSHEVRRSFALDSVAIKGKLPPNCTEIAFPGVHSDVGGGYLPCEQGRGVDPEGSDMLSRITLAVMYREARLCGAPLKLEAAPDTVKRSFSVERGTIMAYNAFIDASRQAVQFGQLHPDRVLSLPLHQLMAQQHRLYILWRKKMMGRMDLLPSVQACDKHDRADILHADKNFQREVALFEKWSLNQTGDTGIRTAQPDWTAIEDFWWTEAPPPSAVCDLFERFVHDSIAGFKPLGKDIPDLQHEMEMLARQAAEFEETAIYQNFYPDVRPPARLTAEETKRLADFRAWKEAHPAANDVRPALDPQPAGQEPLWLGSGYLRFRLIYMGSNSTLPPLDGNESKSAELHRMQEPRDFLSRHEKPRGESDALLTRHAPAASVVRSVSA